MFGMDLACEGLCEAIRKVEAALEQVSRKLEDEFSTRHDGTVNPMHLVKRIHRLQR